MFGEMPVVVDRLFGEMPVVVDRLRNVFFQYFKSDMFLSGALWLK